MRQYWLKIQLVIILFISIFCFSCRDGRIDYIKYNKSTPSIIVSGQEASRINRLFFHYADKREIDSTLVLFSLSKRIGDDETIQAVFIRNTDTVKTFIKRSGLFYSAGSDVNVDVLGNIGFIVWVSNTSFSNINGKKAKSNQHEIHLKIINLSTGEETFDKEIYSTASHMSMLGMKYDPFSSSILFSYVNYFKLFYGYLHMANSKPIDTILNPMEIIRQDNSDKNYPDFLRNKKEVYLSNTSGDHWGFFAHEGKQQIGISKIDTNNQVTDYRIITDTCKIDYDPVLINDTIFYRVSEKDSTSNKRVLKKVASKDLSKY